MVFQKGNHLGKGRQLGSKNERTLALLERLQEEMDAIVEAMRGKDKNTEDYRTLVDALDKVHKQIQLKSGGPTERIEGVEFSIRE